MTHFFVVRCTHADNASELKSTSVTGIGACHIRQRLQSNQSFCMDLIANDNDELIAYFF